jgi:hypothetical protein
MSTLTTMLLAEAFLISKKKKKQGGPDGVDIAVQPKCKGGRGSGRRQTGVMHPPPPMAATVAAGGTPGK